MTGIVTKLLPTGRYRVVFYEGANETTPKKQHKTGVYTAEQLRKLVAQGTCIAGVTDDDIICYESAESYVDCMKIENSMFGCSSAMEMSFDATYECIDIFLNYYDLMNEIVDLANAGESSDIVYEIFYYGDRLHGTENDTNIKMVVEFSELFGAVTFKMPNSIDIIEPDCFAGAIWLKSIAISESDTSLAQNLFSGCEYLQHVELPPYLITIGESCFLSCVNLSEIVFPQHLYSIEDSAFSNSGLERIDLTDFSGSIGQAAFADCKKLKSVHISGNIDFSERVFSNCKALTSVVIEGKVSDMQQRLFYGCSSLQSVTLPENTELAKMCFEDCTSLKRFEIPKGATKIPVSCFRLCTALEEVILPDGVTSIEYGAFCGCTALKKLNIPASMGFSVGTMFGGKSYSKPLSNLVITVSSASPAVVVLRKLLKQRWFKDLVIID